MTSNLFTLRKVLLRGMVVRTRLSKEYLRLLRQNQDTVTIKNKTTGNNNANIKDREKLYIEERKSHCQDDYKEETDVNEAEITNKCYYFVVNIIDKALLKFGQFQFSHLSHCCSTTTTHKEYGILQPMHKPKRKLLPIHLKTETPQRPRRKYRCRYEVTKIHILSKKYLSDEIKYEKEKQTCECEDENLEKDVLLNPTIPIRTYKNHGLVQLSKAIKPIQNQHYHEAFKEIKQIIKSVKNSHEFDLPYLKGRKRTILSSLNLFQAWAFEGMHNPDKIMVMYDQKKKMQRRIRSKEQKEKETEEDETSTNQTFEYSQHFNIKNVPNLQLFHMIYGRSL